MRRFQNALKQWLPLAVLATGLCGLVYLCVQQALRAGANDPQIQLAEDAAAALSRGAAPASVLPASAAPGGLVDVASSLAPFVMVFDAQGALLASSGQLHGRPPALPRGVLEYARDPDEDRVTWQPEPGVRIASIVTAYGGAAPGYVLAGRSLREVEKREDQALTYAALAWAVCLAATLAAVVIGEWWRG
jgi:hypothetical protein